VDLGPVRHILRAVATSVVPESASLDERAWAELESVVSHALDRRELRVQRQFVLFLRLLQRLALLSHGRTLTALSPNRRQRFLAGIERSRFLLVRRGFWGLRTLIFMGYYTREDVADAIGYHASAGGWEDRGGTVATVPLAPTLWVEP
jgi:hypothetical protein